MAAVVVATALGGSAAGQGSAAPSGVLVVANKGDHTLGIIDPAAGRQVATVEESGVTGHEVAVSPDGRTAFVPIYGDSGVGAPGSDGRTLDVIDLASRKRVATLDFGAAQRPHCAHFGADGRLYVSTELGDSITVIDPRTLKVVDTIPTGAHESHMLALTRDGKRIYTSNVHPGSVSVIDVEARKVLAVIPVSGTRATHLPLDRRPLGVHGRPDGARLAVIDTAKNAVARWVELPGVAFGTAPTPDGKRLLVALPGARKVADVDLTAMQVTRTIDVPATPQEIVVRPDGLVGYVSCDASHQVAAIDLAAWQVERLIDAGPMADGLAWAPRLPTFLSGGSLRSIGSRRSEAFGGPAGPPAVRLAEAGPGIDDGHVEVVASLQGWSYGL